MLSLELVARLQSELETLPLIDPHTHINPHSAASRNLGDILGYHYYTELAHSVGLSRDQFEDPELDSKTRVARLVPALANFENTIQSQWLLEICREYFGFEQEGLNSSNWETLYDRASQVLAQPDWEQQVRLRSRLEGVFLTNDFDDPLLGFDSSFYIPCLRTDDLVFQLTTPSVRDRFAQSLAGEAWDADSLDAGLGRLFERFVSRGARACAISLPPTFEPRPVSRAIVAPMLQSLRTGRNLSAADQNTISNWVFWSLAGLCHQYRLPFDLMIGVNRRVYPNGVFQGQDLFDGRLSLRQYARLFNAFPKVTFAVSVLSSGLNQELASYAWIFPNVVTSGHWWYANIPAYIEADCRARLQAVPATKQIGYYSDMYKLEFALPKFRMYRRVLARVLAQDFVIERSWSERRALELGRQVLCDNVRRIFPERQGRSEMG